MEKKEKKEKKTVTIKTYYFFGNTEGMTLESLRKENEAIDSAIASGRFTPVPESF